MREGYLNFNQEEGWLPKWLSPGERGIMPGTLIDAVLADAAVQGILTEEQSELTLKGMLKNVTIPGDTPLNGRIGIEDYVKLGYFPSDQYKESVNHSLDACYCDFCISQLADRLAEAEYVMNTIHVHRVTGCCLMKNPVSFAEETRTAADPQLFLRPNGEAVTARAAHDRTVLRFIMFSRNAQFCAFLSREW